MCFLVKQALDWGIIGNKIDILIFHWPYIWTFLWRTEQRRWKRVIFQINSAVLPHEYKFIKKIFFFLTLMWFWIPCETIRLIRSWGNTVVKSLLGSFHILAFRCSKSWLTPSLLASSFNMSSACISERSLLGAVLCVACCKCQSGPRTFLSTQAGDIITEVTKGRRKYR